MMRCQKHLVAVFEAMSDDRTSLLFAGTQKGRLKIRRLAIRAAGEAPAYMRPFAARDVLYGSDHGRSEGRRTASHRINRGLPAEIVIADTAYDADRVRQTMGARGALAVQPSNRSHALEHSFDKPLYASAHLVDCCFSKLNQFRRVATGFEKTARNSWPWSLSHPSSYECGKEAPCEFPVISQQLTQKFREGVAKTHDTSAIAGLTLFVAWAMRTRRSLRPGA